MTTLVTQTTKWGALFSFAVATAGCAAGSVPAGTGGAGGTDASANATQAAVSGSGETTGAFMGGTGGTGGGSGCQNKCSDDLHSVLDCNGNTISTCPDDQACGANGCESPCQSAADNKSTVGCDYYVVSPDVINEARGACFAAFVVNDWTTPVSISLERAGQTLDISNAARIPTGSGQLLTYAPLPNGQLPPGQVAIVFLSRYGTNMNDCPAGVTPAVTSIDPALYGTGRGSAFHLVTSAPVAAYDMFPFGGGKSAATSATLLIPTPAWDVNYVAVDAYAKSQAVASAAPFIQVVAQEDNTSITISPKAAIIGGAGVDPTGQGQPHTYTLGKGQVLQFTQDAELGGSPIQSDKPIGLWGGATCLNIEVGMVACDSAHQQIPPVHALGNEYTAVRYRNRFDDQEESPPWRIMGAVDGTILTYDPAPPMGAPSTLSTGQTAQFRAPGQFVVRSQDAAHPFYMSAHMSGCQEVNPTESDCRGDPEFVNIVPAAQYLSSYVFFTDPTYPETNLVLVRMKGANGFADVNLDCLGVVSGWAPLGTGGQYELARVDLVKGNFEAQGSCDNGRHSITSTEPFGLTVWGWGSAATGGDFNGFLPGIYSQAVSYAYPSGARVKPINTVTVPPIPN